MSEEIKTGDLVIVVRGHVCDLGTVFTVAAVDLFDNGWDCECCGHESYENVLVAIRDEPIGYPLTWLKRIDPPTLDDEYILEEELIDHEPNFA